MHEAEESFEHGSKLIERGVDGRGAGDDEYIPTVAGLVGNAAEDLADASAHAVTLDGASEASSSRDTEAVVIAAIGYEADDHESVRAGVALLADASKVLPGTECRHGPLLDQPAVRR